MDNVSVDNSIEPGSVDVKTEEVDGVHYPWFKLVGDALVPAYVDQYSGAVGIIEQEHLKIHQGKGFTLAKRLVIDDAGGATPAHEFLGVVPAGVFPHFRSLQVVSDGGDFDVDFYEGATVSANGSLATPYNNNRNSSTEAGLLVYDGPTVTNDGALLEPILAPGTKQTGSFGSEGSNEWNLKVSTNYLIRITNLTAGAGTSRFTVNMFWYE